MSTCPRFIEPLYGDLQNLKSIENSFQKTKIPKTTLVDVDARNDRRNNYYNMHNEYNIIYILHNVRIIRVYEMIHE